MAAGELRTDENGYASGETTLVTDISRNTERRKLGEGSPNWTKGLGMED
jgi:hypothetical protein